MPLMSDSELQRTLGGIEAKLDELLRRAGEHDTDSEALTVRITSLEMWRSYITGAVAILVIVFGYVFKVLAAKGIL